MIYENNTGNMPMPRVKGAFPLVSRVNLICIICAMHEEMLVLVHLILQKGKRYFFFLDTFRAHCAPQQIRTSERASMEFPTSFTVS